MKRAFIDAEFPELKGGAFRQTATAEASNPKAAIAAAFRTLLKSPKLKAKRFTTINATIIISTVVEETSPSVTPTDPNGE